MSLNRYQLFEICFCASFSFIQYPTNKAVLKANLRFIKKLSAYYMQGTVLDAESVEVTILLVTYLRELSLLKMELWPECVQLDGYAKSV